jgi:predicted dehydrogenase
MIGAGGICEEHLAKLALLPDVDVVGICDRSPIVVDAVAERFGVGPAFTDAREMLERQRPDVVHVVTPPATHRELVALALEAGAHVVVEKPVALSHEEYQEMRAQADARGCMLIEVQNYRFNDVVLRAEHMLASGALGELVHAAVRYGVPLAAPGGAYADRTVPHFGHALPGGALLNFISHPASLLTHLIGPATHVCAERRQRGAGPSHDELVAVVIGTRASGSLLVSSHVQPLGFTVQFECTAGVLMVDIQDWIIRHERPGGASARLASGIRSGGAEAGGSLARVGRTIAGRHDWFQGLGTLLGGFYAAVRTGGPPPVTADEMDASVRLVDDLMGASA